MSVSTLSRWLKLSIYEAYKAVSREPLLEITACFTREAITLAVFDEVVSLERICKVATWATLKYRYLAL